MVLEMEVVVMIEVVEVEGYGAVHEEGGGRGGGISQCDDVYIKQTSV